jgi:hypothetical protein
VIAVNVDVEKAAADASGDLVKKVTQIAIVGAVVAIVLFIFWPQIAKVVEAVDTVKRVPHIEDRVMKLENADRDSTVDRRDIRRDVKDNAERIQDTRRALDMMQDKFFPRVPVWQTDVKKGGS